jgi:hypothetical protein
MKVVVYSVKCYFHIYYFKIVFINRKEHKELRKVRKALCP